MKLPALRIRAIAFVVACGLIGGCAKESPTAASAAEITDARALTGQWSLNVPHFTDAIGVDETPAPPITASLTISSVGFTIFGTWTSSNGGAGTIDGTLTPPSSLTFTLTQTTPCAGTLPGTGTLSSDNRSMSGSYFASTQCIAGNFFFTATKK